MTCNGRGEAGSSSESPQRSLLAPDAPASLSQNNTYIHGMEAHNTHMDIKQHKHIGSQAQSNISSHHRRQASPSRISNTKYSSTRQHAALWSPHNNHHSSHSMSCSRLVDLPRRQAHRAGMEVWVDIPGHQHRCRRRPLAALARNVPSFTSFVCNHNDW